MNELSSGAARRPDLDPNQGWFTLVDLAALLGVKPSSVNPLIRRHSLKAKGNGKARMFPRETVEALLARQDRGAAVSTTGYHAHEIKAFTRWLARRRRIPDDPLADMAGATILSDHRHDRRTLLEGELRQLLAAAMSSIKTFRGLDGRDRHYLYLVAMTTGFRAGELSRLTPDNFDLVSEPPTVGLRGSETKNGQTAIQPLPPDVAVALARFLENLPPRQPIWPGMWHEKAAEMLRVDLDAVGIVYVIEGADGPLFADFHDLRHSYVALLDRTGVSLKQAMHLARHSDPKLTMARYGRPQLHDLGAAVERFPSLLPRNRRANGTHIGVQNGPTRVREFTIATDRFRPRRELALVPRLRFRYRAAAG